jgi:hypothetical protein
LAELLSAPRASASPFARSPSTSPPRAPHTRLGVVSFYPNPDHEPPLLPQQSCVIRALALLRASAFASRILRNGHHRRHLLRVAPPPDVPSTPFFLCPLHPAATLRPPPPCHALPSGGSFNRWHHPDPRQMYPQVMETKFCPLPWTTTTTIPPPPPPGSPPSVPATTTTTTAGKGTSSHMTISQP